MKKIICAGLLIITTASSLTGCGYTYETNVQSYGLAGEKEMTTIEYDCGVSVKYYTFKNDLVAVCKNNSKNNLNISFTAITDGYKESVTKSSSDNETVGIAYENESKIYLYGDGHYEYETKDNETRSEEVVTVNKNYQTNETIKKVDGIEFTELTKDASEDNKKIIENEKKEGNTSTSLMKENVCFPSGDTCILYFKADDVEGNFIKITGTVKESRYENKKNEIKVSKADKSKKNKTITNTITNTQFKMYTADIVSIVTNGDGKIIDIYEYSAPLGPSAVIDSTVKYKEKSNIYHTFYVNSIYSSYH